MRSDIHRAPGRSASTRSRTNSVRGTLIKPPTGPSTQPQKSTAMRLVVYEMLSCVALRRGAMTLPASVLNSQ